MDINLPDMLGSEATKIMRAYENEYSCKKTTIIAVTVEGKKNIKMDNLFNDYCKNFHLFRLNNFFIKFFRALQLLTNIIKYNLY